MDNRIRYTLDEVERNVYYQMPKFLFEGDFESLTNDARVLYSLLRDRHSLSIENKWINEDGEVYLIFSRQNMCEMLKLSEKTVTKAMNDLKKFKLVDEQRRGQGKPNLIYLLVPETLDFTKNRKIYGSKTGNFTVLEPENFPPNKNIFKETNNSDVYSYHIQSYQLGTDTHIDPYMDKTDVIGCDATPTQTDETKNRQKNKESFENAPPISGQAFAKPSTAGYSVAEVEETIKSNIDYDDILIENPSYQEMLDGVVHVVVSTIVTNFKDNYIRMGDQNVPAELVKSVFFKLTKEEIEYFIENFNRQTAPTTKLAPYIRASLFNNHGTGDFYWANRVHSDISHLARQSPHA